jgi:hypothetical protein
MKVVNTGKLYRIYGDDLVVDDQLRPEVYIVRFNQFQGFYLEKYSNLEINEDKIYGVHMSKINKVMNSFKKFTRNLGIILSGDKGIGKSLFARILAQTSISAGYPVVVVDTYVPGIHSFIEEIEQEVVVLFDEFDKTFSGGDEDNKGGSAQTSLLSLLDGVSTGKKLYVVTCNKFYSLNEYLINRPGRFHYHFRFNYPTSEEIRTYLQDKISEQYWEEIPKVIAFSGKVNLNYDCLRAIAYELENGEKFEEAINDLNILNLSDQSYDLALHLEDGSILHRNNYEFDLFSNKPENMWLRKLDGSTVRIEFVPSKAKYDVSKGCSIVDGAYLRISEDYDCGDEEAEVVEKLVPVCLMISQTQKNNYRYMV